MVKNLTVREVMSTRLKTVTPGHTLAEIREIFEMYHFHHLPVLDGDKLVGIISSKDFQKLMEGVELVRTTTIVDIDKLYEKTLAERIMSRNPFTVPPDTQVVEVMELFSKEMFHAVPVVEKGKLIGIVSHHDVMYYIA